MGAAPHTGRFYITGGLFKGSKLTLPPSEIARPTPLRVREALFSCLFSLECRIQGAHVLDGFAGSGGIGLECLSRGAAHVTFVEDNSVVSRVLSENIHHIKQQDHTTCVRDFKALNPQKPFDLVFLDPPYGAVNAAGTPLYEDAWESIRPFTHSNTLVILETDVREMPALSLVSLIMHKVYGRVRLSFWRG